MEYREIKRDLFKLKNVDAYAHCIAQDAGMGAGIAVQFCRKYPGMKQDLKSRGLQYPQVAVYQSDKRPDVLNIVSKPVSSRPPKFEDFQDAMKHLRTAIIANDYKSVAMPMIGADLDKLSWETQVLPTIEEQLGDLDIEVIVCFVENNQHHMQKYK